MSPVSTQAVRGSDMRLLRQQGAMRILTRRRHKSVIRMRADPVRVAERVVSHLRDSLVA
jgi:hypothetical protein